MFTCAHTLVPIGPATYPVNWSSPPAPAAARPSSPGTGDYELMAHVAAYTGLRWGELAALTLDQIDLESRTITVDRKIIEIGGTLHLEPPKGRKKRRTIYPRHTPGGYPIAQHLAARIEAELGRGLQCPGTKRGRH